MRCHYGRFEIHRPVPVTMGDTWAVFLEPLERSKLNGPFYWLPVQSPNLCLLFLCHYVELQKTHHQDRLVSLILWATLKRLLCDGLCELGALGGGTKTRKVQIRAQISLLAARTDTELKWSNSVSLTILQTKLSQAGFPVRMNTDKWNHNPFWFVFFFSRPSPSPTKSPRLVSGPLARKADRAHIKKQVPPMQNDLLWKNKPCICQRPGWQEGRYQTVTEILVSRNKQTKIHVKPQTTQLWRTCVVSGKKWGTINLCSSHRLWTGY